MDLIIGILFILLIVVLVRPNAAILNKIPWIRNKNNSVRRVSFAILWFILTMFCIAIDQSSAVEDKTTSEKKQSDFVVTNDSTTVILKGQDTLRFDGKGNIEWTAVGMNDGSSARINIMLSEEVGIYPASVSFDKSNFDGLVYGGFKFNEGEYGIVGLYDFKDDDGLARIGKANDHSSVIKKEDYKHLQSAIELDYKTQIKPLDIYDIKEFVSSIIVYVQNINTGNDQAGERKYTISGDDEAFKVILNGIFPDNQN